MSIISKYNSDSTLIKEVIDYITAPLWHEQFLTLHNTVPNKYKYIYSSFYWQTLFSWLVNDVTKWLVMAVSHAQKHINKSVHDAAARQQNVILFPIW